MPALGVSKIRPDRSPAILIVDDDEGVTQTFARMLQLEGYRRPDGHERRNRPARGLPDPPGRHHPRPAHAAGRRLGFLRGFGPTNDQRDTPVAIVTGDYFLDDSVSAELRQLGAELKFKPLWLEDLVGLARNLLKVTH